MKIEEFEITDKQKKAFNELVKAFKKCRSAGLELYGKQNMITAYPAKVFELDLACPLADNNEDYKNPLPQLSRSGCITDSGADDEQYFKKGVID
jgi:hypothetical protein